jgi:hypothetical protein
MKERPILFSGPMVRAILDGSKTQTRRIVKPSCVIIVDAGGYHWPFKTAGRFSHAIDCPFGRPGDRLWVRETFCMAGEHGSYDAAPADGRPRWPDSLPTIHRCFYRATEQGVDFDHGEGWKPSIHMPRWASRITLEIVSIRVERLHEITRGDCMAEGCPFPNIARETSPQQWFADLWKTINTKPGKTWDDNPWVWVIEFKRVAAC